MDCDCPGDPVVHFKNKLKQSMAGIREIFHGAYNHPVWKETARKCHSCGTCNICCPTCYCFDVDDQTALGTEKGLTDAPVGLLPVPGLHRGGGRGGVP